MEFIEKMVGLMGGKAAQADASAADAQKPAAQSQNATAADEAAQEAAQGPKTYTPEELESFLAEKKKEWQAEQEAQEQERLRSLPEAERLKQEQLSKDAKIASLEAELSRRDLQAEMIAKLDERRLPVSIADLVPYGDRDSTMESLNKLMDTIESIVQEGVMLRLRGKRRKAWAARPHILGSYPIRSPRRFRTPSKSKVRREQSNGNKLRRKICGSH